MFDVDTNANGMNGIDKNVAKYSDTRCVFVRESASKNADAASIQR
jgi:hypothetical protein